MKKKDKELLTRELCARIPYGVRAVMNGKVYEVMGYSNGKAILVEPLMSNLVGAEVEDIRLLLRPMGAMTQNECRAMLRVLGMDDVADGTNEPVRLFSLVVDGGGRIRWETDGGRDLCGIAEATDYLNSIHVDYRGLIGEGLALEIGDPTISSTAYGGK